MRIIFLFSGLLYISCSDNPGNTNSIDSAKQDTTQKTSSLPLDSSKQNKVAQWPQGLPVNIQALKKKYGNGYLLSSVVYNSKLNTTCNNDSVKGFFGEYYFVDSAAMKDFSVKNVLRIFKPGKPEKWRTEATDERFVSITLKTPHIKLWDSLHVGMPVKNFPGELIACKPGTIPSGTFTGISYKEANGIITEIFVELLCNPILMKEN